MIAQKHGQAIYLGWRSPAEARLLIKILTTTFPRDYLDYLLICIVRDKVELAHKTNSRVVGYFYTLELKPIFMAYQLINILYNCKPEFLLENLFINTLIHTIKSVL
jgi:hypothetical protein